MTSGQSPVVAPSMSGPKTGDPMDQWEDIDHAIYHARVFMRLPWRQVAERVGYEGNSGHQSARRRFYRRMAQVKVEDIGEYRAEENAKLDDLEQKWTQLHARSVAAGDLGSEARALTGLTRVSKQRAELNGLQQPVMAEITVTFEETKQELDRALDAFLGEVIDVDLAAPGQAGG